MPPCIGRAWVGCLRPRSLVSNVATSAACRYDFWMLTTGVMAPELGSVVDQDENPVRLADLRGRWVLLWWYPMADTPG